MYLITNDKDERVSLMRFFPRKLIQNKKMHFIYSCFRMNITTNSRLNKIIKYDLGKYIFIFWEGKLEYLNISNEYIYEGLPTQLEAKFIHSEIGCHLLAVKLVPLETTIDKNEELLLLDKFCALSSLELGLGLINFKVCCNYHEMFFDTSNNKYTYSHTHCLKELNIELYNPQIQNTKSISGLLKMEKKINNFEKPIANKINLSLNWYLRSFNENGILAFLFLWTAIETISLTSSKIQPIKEHISKIFDIKIDQVEPVTKIGSIYQLRCDILHKGHLMNFNFDFKFIQYMKLLYIDIFKICIDEFSESITIKYMNNFEINKYFN